MSSSSTRDFDLLLWGATGFAGRLVAEVLAAHPDLPAGRWAIAGRSQAKLAALRDHLAERVDADRLPETILADPHGLDPADARGTGGGRDASRPVADEVIGGWAAPFLMAPINTRIVRRSNALLGHPWGQNFSYREVMRFPPGPLGASSAWAYTLAFGAFLKALQSKSSRRAVERMLLPAPGEGPSAERIAKGHFHVRIHGFGPGRTPLHVDVRGGRDPGYGATATMLAESALALLATRDVEPENDDTTGAPSRLAGGVLTPATALGQVLIDRLARTEVTLSPAE